MLMRYEPTPKVGLNSASAQLRQSFDELAEIRGEVSIEPTHAQGPGGIGGFPPGLTRTYLRMSQFIHRQVRGRAGRRAVTPGPIHPGHTGQGRDVIGVVPVV